VTDVARGLSLGADGYVTKPFAAEDLIRAAKSLLDKRRVASRKNG